jgi:hypothetical protein
MNFERARVTVVEVGGVLSPDNSFNGRVLLPKFNKILFELFFEPGIETLVYTD